MCMIRGKPKKKGRKKTTKGKKESEIGKAIKDKINNSGPKKNP